MENSISNRQLFFMLVITLTTYTSIDLPKIAAAKVGRVGWIAVLAAAVLFSGGAVLVTKLNNRFPGMVMYDYSAEIAGKLVARVIAAYYILYFVIIGVYLKIKLVTFLTSNFLPDTPQSILLAFSVLLFAFVAYKGVTNVARLFELFGVLFIVTTLFICTIMLFQGMVYNIRPFFNPPELRLLPGAFPDFLFAFGGIEVLLVVPFTKKNKRAPLVAFLTLLFIGVFYIVIVEGTICILGINNTALYKDPLIEAIKIVYLPIIERTDIFYFTIGLMSLFAGMFMVFLTILEFICRFFTWRNRAVATSVLAVVLYGLCLIGLQVNNISDVMDAIAPYIVMTSAFGIPGLLLLTAVLRKKSGASETGGGT